MEEKVFELQQQAVKQSSQPGFHQQVLSKLAAQHCSSACRSSPSFISLVGSFSYYFPDISLGHPLSFLRAALHERVSCVKGAPRALRTCVSFGVLVHDSTEIAQQKKRSVLAGQRARGSVAEVRRRRKESHSAHCCFL